MAELDSFQLRAGDVAPFFELPGVDGRVVRLDQFRDAPLLLVVFSCNHCPYANAWEGRLISLQKEYAGRGPRTVLINSNETENYPEDRMERMVERARDKGYPFPYLRDDSQEVARAYGALVTPHPMLFNRDRRLIFQGRVDDDHLRADRVRHRYLADAIEAGLDGRTPSPAQLSVVGCSIKWKA
ncbi:MAG: thioredoxin family protein [Thermoplasmata archaeon]